MEKIGAEKILTRWRRNNDKGWDWMKDRHIDDTPENRFHYTATDWARDDLDPEEHAALEALGFKEFGDKVDYGKSLLRSQMPPFSWLFK